MTEEEKRDRITLAVGLCDLSQTCTRKAKEFLKAAGIETVTDVYTSNITLWQAERLAPVTRDLP